MAKDKKMNEGDGPTEIHTSIEFAGAVTLDMTHKAVTMSAHDAILLGSRLIMLGIYSQAEPQTSYGQAVH